MNPDQPIRQIIFENGSVAYAGPGHDFTLQTSNGSAIRQVNARLLSKAEIAANRAFIDDPKLQVAEPHKSGWRIRQKTGQELSDEGIKPPKDHAL